MSRLFSSSAPGLICLLAASFAASVQAAERMIEEIVVSARLQSESLQDVPVTIAAMTEADLDRYNISSLVDAAKLVPNMVIAHGASGNGSNLRLRGIGSSSISAAFDHSVAINLDGVVVNRGRFIHNSYLDMRQIEVLKGPQSLYFGKSSTAGVVSIATNDPGDTFELQFSAGLEAEYDGTFGEFVISGPLTDTFGARLAVGFTENDELFDNYAWRNNPDAVSVNGAQPFFGDESLNTRLTLLWNPTDNFEAKLKYSYSEYTNNGGGSVWAESLCPEGASQRTAIPAASSPIVLFQSIDDCRLNGNTTKVNLHPGLRAGLPRGYDNGVHGLEQETDFLSLTLTWDLGDVTLTSVTGHVDLYHWELDDYSYGAGVFGGLHNNVYESLSQELRLASNLDGAFNFQVGLYWQQIEQEFDAYQYAFNLPLVPQAVLDAIIAGNTPFASYAQFVQATAAGRDIVAPVDPMSPVLGPDPFTGNQYDYNKDHFLDTDVLSAFLAVYWDISERTELTFGVRYTKEEKDGYILIPYLHAAASIFGFSAPPRIDGLEFDDSNVSPEIAVNHHLNDNISVFVAYKEGFKSGGIDNSALPTAALNPQTNNGDFSFLEYDSEEAKGFEVGMKGSLLDGSMRLTATAFSYEYSDLQVQLFNSTIIQFETSNASALDARGVEFDMLWNTDLEGLTLRTAWAWTDTSYSEDFINATGENLNGQDISGSADITGFVGFTLEIPAFADWSLGISGDARYTGDYPYTVTLNPYEQESFWLLDTSLSLISPDGAHQFSLIGRNLTDETWAVTAGAIPGRCPNFDPTRTNAAGMPMLCNDTGANSLDQTVTTALGRTISLQYRFMFGR